jgi:hypothetical protein
MKSRFAHLAASMTAALSIAASAATACDVAAQVPATALATRSVDIIERATRALVAREGESRITRLWVFPTGDANSVFVHYRTTNDVDAHEPGPTIEHLALIEMNGERIAKLHDLTTAPASVVAAVSTDEVTARP